MKQIVIATQNAGKRSEIVAALPGLKNVEFVHLSALPAVTEPDENGTTYVQNAEIKAAYYAKKLKKVCLAEDSGLELSALPEQFGLRTRREIDAKDDIAWLGKFLEMLEEKEDRKATFFSAMAVADASGKILKSTLGETVGEIVEFPMAPLEKGIPVSAVFVPDGFDDVYSAMTPTQKSQCSHRGKAADPMRAFLADWSSPVQ